MSSSYDPAMPTSIDKVRFLIGDTKESFQLTNDEIAGILSMVTGDAYKAAVVACRTLATKYVRMSGNAQVGPFKIDYRAMADGYLSLIPTIEDMRSDLDQSGAGGVPVPFGSGYRHSHPIDNADSDYMFSIGMHDGVETGGVNGYSTT